MFFIFFYKKIIYFREYEIKLVEDLIQPQGAKLKPSENLLIEFGKACESLQIQTIGSILLTSLKYQENNWKSLLVFCLDKLFFHYKQ